MSLWQALKRPQTAISAEKRTFFISLAGFNYAKLGIFLDCKKKKSYFCGESKTLTQNNMILKCILGWLAFDLIVYLAMWFDTAYYKYDLPTVARKIMDSFTEEEE